MRVCLSSPLTIPAFTPLRWKQRRPIPASNWRIFSATTLANADQTPQGQLAGIIAVLEAVIGEALVRLGNATSVNDAVGTQLDTLGELLDILRQRPTRSRVTATVTGVAGTNLPAASRARTADGDVFRTVADVALAPSPGVSVEMEAVDEGAVMAAAGTLTQIVTVVAGWETITNAAAAVIGIPRQAILNIAVPTDGERRIALSGRWPLFKSAIDEALGGKQNVVENDKAVSTLNRNLPSTAATSWRSCKAEPMPPFNALSKRRAAWALAL